MSRTEKILEKEDLRDNMTNLEVVLNMLAETATTEIFKKTWRCCTVKGQRS